MTEQGNGAAGTRTKVDYADSRARAAWLVRWCREHQADIAAGKHRQLEVARECAKATGVPTRHHDVSQAWNIVNGRRGRWPKSPRSALVPKGTKARDAVFGRVYDRIEAIERRLAEVERRAKGTESGLETLVAAIGGVS